MKVPENAQYVIRFLNFMQRHWYSDGDDEELDEDSDEIDFVSWTDHWDVVCFEMNLARAFASE